MQFKCHHHHDHHDHHHDGAPQHEGRPFVCAMGTMCLDLKVQSKVTSVHIILKTVAICILIAYWPVLGVLDGSQCLTCICGIQGYIIHTLSL